MEALEQEKSVLERMSELVIRTEEDLEIIRGLLKNKDFEGTRQELDSLIGRIFTVDSLEWTGGLLAGKQFPGAHEMHHALVEGIRKDMKKEIEDSKRIYIRFPRSWSGVDPVEFDNEDAASLSYAYVRQLKEVCNIDTQLSYEKNLYSSYSRTGGQNSGYENFFDNLSHVGRLEVYRDLSEISEEHRG